jgi:hypothetical protein
MSKEKDYTMDKRLSVFREVAEYSHISKDGDFIEVTRWINGEGYDVTIGTIWNYRQFTISEGEFKLLKFLIKSLTKEMDKEFKKKQEKKYNE